MFFVSKIVQNDFGTKSSKNSKALTENITLMCKMNLVMEILDILALAVK